MSPTPLPPILAPIDRSTHTFVLPKKRIHTATDVPAFLSSPAYARITSFILHLNASVSPLDQTTYELSDPEDFTINSPTITISAEVQGIISLLDSLSKLVESAPPEPGPRRFGNVACRKWHALVKEQLSSGLLEKGLPPAVLTNTSTSDSEVVSAQDELCAYLLGSFGSPQRLDYGTGHELSFAAFLCGIWVLCGFTPGHDEKALVFNCFNAYFALIRKLVKTYTLEPAGSHGVWGLDDHSFLPYVFGSSQLTTYPPGNTGEGAKDAGNVPGTGDVVRSEVVNRERDRNLYFQAIGFINDVKTGPFWEHSPILFDISGVPQGWGKINKGMLKMYNAEVLGKFPVVQHFPFGSIFSWGSSDDTSTSTSTSTLPPSPSTQIAEEISGATTTAPWAKGPSQNSSGVTDSTTATRIPPHTTATTGPIEVTRAPWAVSSDIPSSILTSKSGEHSLSTAPKYSPTTPRQPPGQFDGGETRAPWATSPPTEEETHQLQPQATEAYLGGKRTSSPDSKLAAAMEADEGEGRRGSMGTGGVRVAERGDLRRKNTGSVGKSPVAAPPGGAEAMTKAPWAR